MSAKAPAAAATREARSLAELRQALAAGDAQRALEPCRALFEFDPRSLSETLDDAQLRARREIHETLDRALRRLFLADDAQDELWQRLLLPAAPGVFPLPLWTANARWLRACGSTLPDANEQHLEASGLAELGLAEQARALGRYCLVNDGARAVDVRAVLASLDAHLQPFFVSWLVAVHAQSPDRLGTAQALAHQRSALEALLEHFEAHDLDRAASPLELETIYDAAYREGLDLRRLATVLNGGALTTLFTGLRGVGHGEAPALDSLERGAHVLVAPNWRADHVAHRCLSPLLTGMAERGATALLVREHGAPRQGPPAPDWRALEVELPGATHHLVELGDVASALAARELEFAFFPEITPSNTSAWLATQRLARVQATGYGYPVTSGLATIDYFFGGSEVEGPNASEQYSEELVLLPGLGVSTTPPPAPRKPRERPLDDPRLRLVSAAGFRKLNPALLAAWDEILRVRADASLDLFPAMSARAAQRRVPELAAHLPHEAVTLHPSVPQLELIDQLVEADLYLDSYPFGGFNTLVEVLACGCPFVTLEGDFARNRFGAAILRRLQLPEFLIAHDWREYVTAATRVLSDLGLRRELRARLADRDAVLRAIIDHDASEYFDAAVRRCQARSRNIVRAGCRTL